MGKYSTSGAWISYFLIGSVFVVFMPWEFIQLYRRRKGNKSAQTMSQWISDRIAESKGWLIFITIFTVIVWGVMTWIIFGHWPIWCEWFDVLCWERD